MSKDVDNIRDHWDEFRDFCEDKGINLGHPNDWTTWWECWEAALTAEREEIE